MTRDLVVLDNVPMHKVSIRERAVTLRRKGYSYPYISLKTGLSKSTLSGWLAEIPYAPNKETIAFHGKAIAAANIRKVKIRQEATEKLREKASNEIACLSQRDLFMFGLGLYLGEGSKTQGNVRIVNADPGVIRGAVAWFKLLGVKNEQFSVRVFVYPDNDLRACLQFWAKETRIPETQFQKEYVDRRMDKKAKKTGKLPYGTLHLTIRSRGRKEYGVEFLRKIQAWNECVLGQTRKRD